MPYLIQILLNIRCYFIGTEQICRFSVDKNITYRAPINPQIHNGTQIVSMRHILCKFLNQRSYRQTDNRKILCIPQTLLTAET